MQRGLVIGRIGLVIFGLVLALVLMELTLQIGSLFVSGRTGPSVNSWTTGDRRILCIGDSNTYGIRLPERQRDSYPAQLDSLWNSGDRSPVEVLNLGYPGTNSSLVLRRFPEMLEAFAPDIVVIMVGVNDFWTEPIPLESRTNDARLWGFVKRHSRLYKGYYMLQRRAEADGLELAMVRTRPNSMKRGETEIRFGEHHFVLGWNAELQKPKKAEADLHDNLLALAVMSENSSSQLVLMTYPGRWKYYALANRTIRAVAGEAEVPLIDLESVFRPLCPERRCDDWLYSDQHPTADGYQRVAETMVDQLRALGYIE